MAAVTEINEGNQTPSVKQGLQRYYQGLKVHDVTQTKIFQRQKKNSNAPPIHPSEEVCCYLDIINSQLMAGTYCCSRLLNLVLLSSCCIVNSATFVPINPLKLANNYAYSTSWDEKVLAQLGKAVQDQVSRQYAG
jgi:hypothetical protein